MHFNRRTFVAAAMAGTAVLSVPGLASSTGGNDLYGLIGRIRAMPGQRDALIDILIVSGSGMPGCLSYVVARDPSDPDAIWVTEVWESRASHQASLSLPAVKDAIARGRALIAGFDQRIETEPAGGHGIRAESASRSPA